MSCIRCEDDNLTDYPVCRDCAPVVHFSYRSDCQCTQCTIHRHCLEMAKLHGGTLVIKKIEIEEKEAA